MVVASVGLGVPYKAMEESAVFSGSRAGRACLAVLHSRLGT